MEEGWIAKKKICEGYCLAEHSLYCNNCAVLPRVLQYDFHSDIFAVQLVNSSLTLYRICFVCILRNLHHVHCFGGKVWGIDHFSTMWLLWGEPSKANFNLKCLLPVFILINIASNITIIINDTQCLLSLIYCWVVDFWLYGQWFLIIWAVGKYQTRLLHLSLFLALCPIGVSGVNWIRWARK